MDMIDYIIAVAVVVVPVAALGTTAIAIVGYALLQWVKKK